MSQDNSSPTVANTYAVEGTSINNTGVFGWTTLGDSSGTPSPVSGHFGVQGYAQSNGVGVYGNSTTGIGVYGVTAGGTTNASGKYGVYGSSNSADAIHGVYNGTGGSAAVSGTNGSATGYGVWGYNSSGGVGTFGTSSVTGVEGTCTGAGGSGVTGNSGTGQSSGVFGYSHSSTGKGLYGYDDAGGYGGFGVSSNGIGLYGATGGASTADTGEFAVYGTNPAGDAIHGIYTGFSGQSAVYGGATATGGTGGNGVFGHTASAAYSGVVGNATAGGNGVLAECSGGGSYGCYGIQATCSGTNCLAGYFANDVYINGTYYPPSDRRLKKNITPLKGALDQLLQLSPVNFEWIEPEKHNNMTGPQIGFIAQDVEKIFPKWVRTGTDGLKALSVAQIEGLEVESIRTLKTENDELRAQVAKLQGQVAILDGDHAKLALLADHLDRLESGKDPMTGDRGFLWMIAMVVTVGGSIIVTRKQNQKQA